jgi:hypothetical protein
MVAEMMRFYHLSDEQCLKMPIIRFLALSKRISVVQAEEEIRAISIQHADKPGERIKELIKRVQKDTPKRSPGKPTAALIDGQMVRPANDIEIERARQKAAHEKAKAEWQARKQQGKS